MNGTASKPDEATFALLNNLASLHRQYGDPSTARNILAFANWIKESPKKKSSRRPKIKPKDKERES